MTKSGHLWAIGYDDVGQAAQVRDEIQRLGDKHCLILLDMAVAVRYPDGCVTLDGEPFVVAPLRGRGFAGFLAGLALRRTATDGSGRRHLGERHRALRLNRNRDRRGFRLRSRQVDEARDFRPVRPGSGR